jgi:3-oxoadipate enol-lactonase/4-carboxymuconolactone decarboxylase
MEGNVGTGNDRLYYRVDGPDAAPPVLLINSLGSTLDLWAAQAQAWSRTCRVIRYDMRGHGQSGVPPGEYTLADLGADAIRVLDAVGAVHATICGISIGGLTAMWLGVNEPWRVRGIVIANTAARVGTPERWIDRVAKVRNEGMTAVADMAMTTWFTSAFREREPAVVARFHEMVATTSPDGYVGCCAALRDADLRAEIKRIAAQALVVAGERDATTTVEDADFIFSQLHAGARLTLPAAHLTNVECAEEFSRRVGKFLEMSAVTLGNVRRQIGDETRRRILGHEHVDRATKSTTPFTADFQDLITRYVWGEIWTRFGLDARTRRVLVIGTMIALGRWEEFAMHVRAAVVEGGFTADDVKEIVLQQAVYCGVPAAHHALKVAGEVLDSLGPT